MKTSTAGIDLIKSFEGLELQAYIDAVGVPTIGYGHTKTVTKKDVSYRKKITEAQALELLRKDLEVFEEAVERLVVVQLTQNQFDALVSFTYNLGEGNLQKSTLLKKVNAFLFAQAAEEFAKWNKAGGKVLNGLTRRREAERKMFLGE